MESQKRITSQALPPRPEASREQSPTTFPLNPEETHDAEESISFRIPLRLDRDQSSSIQEGVFRAHGDEEDEEEDTSLLTETEPRTPPIYDESLRVRSTPNHNRIPRRILQNCWSELLSSSQEKRSFMTTTKKPLFEGFEEREVSRKGPLNMLFDEPVYPANFQQEFEEFLLKNNLRAPGFGPQPLTTEPEIVDEVARLSQKEEERLAFVEDNLSQEKGNQEDTKEDDMPIQGGKNDREEESNESSKEEEKQEVHGDDEDKDEMPQEVSEDEPRSRETRSNKGVQSLDSKDQSTRDPREFLKRSSKNVKSLNNPCQANQKDKLPMKVQSHEGIVNKGPSQSEIGKKKVTKNKVIKEAADQKEKVQRPQSIPKEIPNKPKIVTKTLKESEHLVNKKENVCPNEKKMEIFGGQKQSVPTKTKPIEKKSGGFAEKENLKGNTRTGAIPVAKDDKLSNQKKLNPSQEGQSRQERMSRTKLSRKINEEKSVANKKVDGKRSNKVSKESLDQNEDVNYGDRTSKRRFLN